MTIVEPIPDLQWGKGTWQDYISNWRTRDTNWMQERLILRYQTSAQRTADWGAAPRAGQVTYNEETKTLEMWRGAPVNSWVRSLMFQNLVSSVDTGAGVNLFHVGSIASPKAITITPTSLLVDMTTTNFLNGVHTVDATGMTLKTGAKTVKLSTDATNLVSDSPIKATGLDLTGGTGTVLSAAGRAVQVGALTADSATIPSISMSGTLTGNIGNFSGVLTGGTVNGGSGTIGGVAMSGGNAVASTFIASGAFLRGDANMGYWSHRNPSSGAVSAPAFTVDATYLRVRASNGIPFDRHDGGHTGGWVGCVFTSDPGAANAPTGSILLL